MLAVLRKIRANVRHGNIQEEESEVVYVSLMKNPAAEVTDAFLRFLEPLGMPCLAPYRMQLQQMVCKLIMTMACQSD